MSDATQSQDEPTPFIENITREFVPFLRLVVSRFGRDECMRSAAALSYTSLLALVPLGAIAFAILKAFPVFDDVQEQIKALIFNNFLPESVMNVQEYFDQFVGQTSELTAIGIVVLALTAIMLLATIEAALNSIFHVKAKRPLVPRMIMFWAVITLGPLLLGGSLSLRGYLYAWTEWAGAESIPGIGGLMAQLLPSVLGIFAFSVLYAIVPYRPVKVVHALIGGVTAGLLFGLLRNGFALYLAAFPAYETIYGALATIPIILIWMYLSWAVVLIGAEVAASLPEWGHARAARGYDELSSARKLDAAIAALERLWRTRRGDEDKHPTVSQRRADVLDQALEALRQAGFVALSDQGQWLLVREPDTLTIADVAHGLGLSPNHDDIPTGGASWRATLKQSLGGADSGMGKPLRSLFDIKN